MDLQPIMEQLQEEKGRLGNQIAGIDAAITSLTALGGGTNGHANGRTRRINGKNWLQQHGKPHWTQTPAGRRKMRQIQKDRMDS